MFSFARNFQTVFHSACTIGIPISNEWEFLLFHIIVPLICIWGLLFNIKNFSHLTVVDLLIFFGGGGGNSQYQLFRCSLKYFCHFIFVKIEIHLFSSDSKVIVIQKISGKKYEVETKKNSIIQITTMNQKFADIFQCKCTFRKKWYHTMHHALYTTLFMLLWWSFNFYHNNICLILHGI